MKVYPEQLPKLLQQKLAPAYLITGDEPLLTQETRDAIITTAHQAGFTDNERMTVSKSFDWNQLKHASQSLSLFSSKQILECQTTSNKFSEAGKKTLLGYLKTPPNNKLLLITTPKLETGVQNSAWFKQFNKIGVVIQIWPIQPAYLPRWIYQRLQKVEVTTTREGIQLLIELNEGNLLALAQAIEKLRLMYGPGSLTTEQIATATSDTARYNIFILTDTVLQGDLQHTLRILESLRQEAVEPTLILWALTREIRNLVKLAQARDDGLSLEQALIKHHVWEKRKPLITNALRRYAISQLYAVLVQCANIDRMIKGVSPGNVWDEFGQLMLTMIHLKSDG